MGRNFTRVKKLVRALRQTRQRPGEIESILVAHNLLLGDTILLAPLFKALALAYPDARRVALVRPAFLSLFANRPYGFEALPIARRDDGSAQDAIMQSGPYDLALVADDNRYAWLARAAGARWIRGFADDIPAWKNWMLDEPVAYRDTPSAWADMAVDLAGLPAPPPYSVGEWPAPPAEAFVPPARDYVVLHVGASSPLKHWPAARWRLLADDFAARGYPIVWSGGRGEESVLECIGARQNEINLMGQLELPGLWALLAGARFLVCPDTGIGHLARLVGVPSVALFGPGSSVVHGPGAFFRNSAFWSVTKPDFPCRDQSILFRRTVPWVMRCGRSVGSAPDQCPHGSCMDAIESKAVVQVVRNALERIG